MKLKRLRTRERPEVRAFEEDRVRRLLEDARRQGRALTLDVAQAESLQVDLRARLSFLEVLRRHNGCEDTASMTIFTDLDTLYELDELADATGFSIKQLVRLYLALKMDDRRRRRCDGDISPWWRR